MSKYHLPILLALLAPFAFADEDSARADELRLQAKALRAEAEASYTAAQPECDRRFLVNRCLDQAKSARIATIGKARELEIEASRIDLARKQREVEERGLEVAPASIPEAPTPFSDPVPADDSAAEAIRRAREEEAVRAEARARELLQQRDAEKAQTRAAAEAAAAERAEKAARDRERYDERIRKREAERATQTPTDQPPTD